MKRNTLAWYVKRMRQATPRGFIELRPRSVAPLSPVVEARAFEVTLSCGVRVDGVHFDEVVRLARALAAVSS